MLFTTDIINKEYVLNRYSQEDIFSYYLGIQMTNKLFCNPLRKDYNPTCSFYYKGSKLYLRDFSGWFHGDCFNLVCKLKNCTFRESFNIILGELGGKTLSKPRVTIKKTSKSKIVVKWRKYSREDLMFWINYGVSYKTLSKFNVGCVDTIWLNDVLHKSNCINTYGYYFSKDEIKIYFPKQDTFRFLGNSKCLQGYNQLPQQGDLLVVTKSMKDIMTFYELGVIAIAPQAESVILSDEQYKDLSSRFKRIISLYDFDLAGIRGANKMKRKFSIKPYFLTNGRFKTKNYNAKDIADLRKLSKEEAIQFVDSIK